MTNIPFLYVFMQEFGIKCKKKMWNEFKGRDNNVCSWGTIVIYKAHWKSVRNRKEIERVFF